MAFLVEQLIGEKAVQLGYEEIVRPFSFGTNWTTIRLGVLWAVNGYSVMPDFTAPYVGVCTGYGGRYAASSTDAFWVPTVHYITSSGGNLGGTPPAVYYRWNSGTSNVQPLQRVGTTTSVCSLSFTGYYTEISANPSNHYTGFFLTINKGTVGAAGVTIQVIAPSGAATAGATNLSRGAFLAQLENETTAISPNSLFGGASGSGTNLPTRFVKDWDSMMVGWVKSTPTLSIACMTVCRFA